MKIFKNKFLAINDNVCAGVLSGLAYALGVKVWIVRLVFLLSLMFIFNWSFLLYILLAISLPEWKNDPKDYHDICE